jgi:hypothetical protein
MSLLNENDATSSIKDSKNDVNRFLLNDKKAEAKIAEIHSL